LSSFIVPYQMLNTVVLEKYPGELYEGEKTAAEGGFSCKAETNCFLSFAAVFLAEKDCAATVKVYLNGIAQEFRARLSLRAGEFSTASFTIPISVGSGTHTVSVTASGLAELQDVSAETAAVPHECELQNGIRSPEIPSRSQSRLNRSAAKLYC